MTDAELHPSMLPPKVTPEHLARLEDWVDFYTGSVRESWAEQGTDMEDPETQQLLAWIPDDVRCVDIPEWMPLLPALMLTSTSLLLGEDGDEPASPEGRDKFRNAMRTVKAASQDERDAAICYQMGWEQQSLNKFRERREYSSIHPHSTGECSLYRYFDKHGQLLYVGIAADPNLRDEQHRTNSKWHRFQVERTVEWHPTRDDAHAAEVAAIQNEDPVFNLTHASARQKKAALDYLFDRVDAMHEVKASAATAAASWGRKTRRSA